MGQCDGVGERATVSDRPAWAAALDALRPPALVVRQAPGSDLAVVGINRAAEELLGPFDQVATDVALLDRLGDAIGQGRAPLTLAGLAPGDHALALELEAGDLGALGDDLALLVVWDCRPHLQLAGELRAADARSRAVLNALDVGVVLADERGVARSANPRADQIMGLAAGGIIGTGVSDWITVREDGTYWPPETNPTAAALTLGVPQVRQVVGTAPQGGVRRWLEVNAQPLFHPGEPRPWGVVTSFMDITDRWEADARLQRALDRLQRSFGTSLVGMAVVDARGRFVEVNAAFCNLLGRTEADLLERRFAEVSEPTSWAAVSPDGASLPVASTEVEYGYRAPDGSAVSSITSFTPLPGADDDDQHFVCAQDLTERKRLEHQLVESQKMEAVGQLAGGVAHDFNNLLMVIMGNIDAVVEHATLDPDGTLALDHALAATERGADLVDSLLSFSRHQVLVTQPVDVNDLVSTDVALLSRLIGDDIHLELRLDPAVGPVLADRGRLGQVLMNLVLNARDAMPGGGRLTIATSPAAAPPDAVDDDHDPDHPAGAGTIIEVRDTGVGMEPSVQARAFDPFFTTKPRGRGTGLGLSTAYGIVTQLHGTLGVRSQPGGGSTFRIWLPPASRPATRPSGPRGDDQVPAPGLALVAEDDPEVLSLVASVLREHGWAVLEAADGRHARSLVQSLGRRPDLLVTDLVMPRTNGTELAAALRARWVDLPVLFMTGYADLAPTLHRGEPSTLLPKPFNRRQLLRAVARLLDGAPAPEPSPARRQRATGAGPDRP